MRSIILFLLTCYALLTSAQQNSTYTQTISNGGQYIAISKDKLVYVYELTSDVSKFNVSMGEDIAGTGFTNDETLFIVMDYNYVFRAFDLSNEGEELWSSDILEFIDRPSERFKVRILESQSGDYLLAQHMGQSIVLDRYTGELVGYADLDIELYSQRDDNPISVWPNGPNSFEIMNVGAKDYCRAEVKIEGYGAIETSKKFGNTDVAFPVLAHYPGKSLIYETDEWQTKTEVALNGKPFRKGKGDRVDFPDGVFSPDGNYLATGKFTEKSAVYEYASGKRIAQLDIKKVPYFVNADYVVFGGYKAAYQVYSAKSGSKITSVDREEDLKYKGTSIAKSANYRKTGTIFFDDFDDNYQEWSTKESEKYTSKIIDGNYILKSNSGSYGRWNSKIAIDPFRDFEIEIKLKSVTDEEKSGFGIFWGRQPKHGFRSDFRIRNTGEYYIGKYQRGKWYASKSWTGSDKIKKQDYNTFKVQKEGNTYSYFLNGEPVHQEPFYGFLGSKVGINYAQGTMWVDYIKVSYLSEKTQSSAHIYATEFDDDEDKWLSKNVEGKYNQKIEDGHYRYEVIANSAYYQWNPRFFIDEYQDYELEMAVKFVETNSTHLLGITWGKETEAWNYYRFGISPKGSFRIDYKNNGKFTTLQDWTRHSAIKTTAYNQLKIKKIGEQYKFYINNQLVGMEKGHLTFGPMIGFTVPHETVAHVDYIRARYINKNSEPYRDYWYRTGNRIFIPYMRPDNPANQGKKVLIGDPVFCKTPPKREAGGLGFATTSNKIQWDYWIVKDEDEIAFGKQELRNIYPGGWLVWEHNIKCR